MAVTSRQSKPSAVITTAQLDRARGPIERGAAVVILVLSFVGTIVVCLGGVPAVLAVFRAVLAGEYSRLWGVLAGVLAGVLIQGVLTWLQWTYKTRSPAVAWLSRAADAGLTATGFGPLFAPLLTIYAAGRGLSVEPIAVVGVSVAMCAAWIVIGLVSLGLAWFPEDRLVD